MRTLIYVACNIHNYLSAEWYVRYRPCTSCWCEKFRRESTLAFIVSTRICATPLVFRRVSKIFNIQASKFSQFYHD